MAKRTEKKERKENKYGHVIASAAARRVGY
jgi:hypothetical protein